MHGELSYCCTVIAFCFMVKLKEKRVILDIPDQYIGTILLHPSDISIQNYKLKQFVWSESLISETIFSN